MLLPRESKHVVHTWSELHSTAQVSCGPTTTGEPLPRVCCFSAPRQKWQKAPGVCLHPRRYLGRVTGSPRHAWWESWSPRFSQHLDSNGILSWLLCNYLDEFSANLWEESVTGLCRTGVSNPLPDKHTPIYEFILLGSFLCSTFLCIPMLETQFPDNRGLIQIRIMTHSREGASTFTSAYHFPEPKWPQGEEDYFDPWRKIRMDSHVCLQ